MAIPFALPTEDEAEEQERRLHGLLLDVYGILQQVIRNRSYQYSPAQNHRVHRRSGDVPGPRDHPVILVDTDLSRLPLPDLVSSAIEQLPPPMPQVTASAPSSPTRDVAFQFPEFNPSVPVPSPRPRPRKRRRVSENSSILKKEQPSTSYSIHNNNNHHHHSNDENEWASVGANLRNIADDFHASKNKESSSGGEKSSLTLNGLVNNDRHTTTTPESFLSLLIPAPLRETLWTTVALYVGWRLVSHLR